MRSVDVDVMAGGAALREVQQLATETRERGFGGITFTETGRTAYLSVAAAALAAPELTYSTGVAVAFPRSPMVTAATAWELADLTDGRFLLGIGTQVRAHIERRYSSEFEHPGPRLREYVEAVRAIFRAFQGTAPLEFRGEFFRHELLPAMWSPGPIAHPDVPIYISAVGPWMVRMAGEVADGVHVHPLHSMSYIEERLLPGIADGAAASGRDPRAVALAVPVFTIVGDSAEERAPWRALARSQIAFYGSTRNYAFQFDMLGFDGTSARLNERLKAGDVAGMSELITDEMLDEFAVEASWDELGDRLVDRYDGVASRLIMYFADAMRRRDPAAFARLGEVAGDVARRTA
jgi:probable F420-dependent oxidoreductase